MDQAKVERKDNHGGTEFKNVSKKWKHSSKQSSDGNVYYACEEVKQHLLF